MEGLAMNKSSMTQKRIKFLLLCFLIHNGEIFTDYNVASLVKSAFYDLKQSFAAQDSDRRIDDLSVSEDVSDEHSRVSVLPNLPEWMDACKSLPKNRDNASWRKNSGVDPGKYSGFKGTANERWHQFKAVLDTFLKQKSTSSLASESNWELDNTGQKLPKSEFFDSSLNENEFMPFAQKLIANPSDKFIVRGDLHGDIASLLTQLASMKKQGLINDDFKLKQGYNMLFLGDYVDRGMYGAEVMYTIMRLMNANPNNVFAVRGNHEDLRINTSFQREVAAKFDDKADQRRQQIGRMYKNLPVVLYLGDQAGRYFQCCHGGVEQGYDPDALLNAKNKKYQLLGALHRARGIQKVLDSSSASDKVKDDMRTISSIMQDDIVLSAPAPRFQLPLGFMWNDFDVDGRAQVRYQFGRGLVYGQEATGVSLHSKIIGIMRAHQHAMDPTNKLMQQLLRNKGICKLWKPDELTTERELGDKGEVLMFNVAPDGGAYGRRVGFDYDAAAIIEPRAKGPWKMEVQNYHPFEA